MQSNEAGYNRTVGRAGRSGCIARFGIKCLQARVHRLRRDPLWHIGIGEVSSLLVKRARFLKAAARLLGRGQDSRGKSEAIANTSRRCDIGAIFQVYVEVRRRSICGSIDDKATAPRRLWELHWPHCLRASTGGWIRSFPYTVDPSTNAGIMS